jgi:hypothetical protein
VVVQRSSAIDALMAASSGIINILSISSVITFIEIPQKKRRSCSLDRSMNLRKELRIIGSIFKQDIAKTGMIRN